MIVLLTLLTALAVLLLVGVLVYYLLRVIHALESIGGAPNSYLARIGYGVRAIEKETSHLGPQVTRLNQGLQSLGVGLGAVDDHLGTVAGALSGGKEGST